MASAHTDGYRGRLRRISSLAAPAVAVLTAAALSPAAAAPAEAAQTAPHAAQGVLFDDFSYTSSTDPSVAAHGWTVRTGTGSPGPAGAQFSASAITFPADPDDPVNSPGGHVMQLTASTDGTAADTTEAEIETTQRKFLAGTYAARVNFSDSPVSGPDGDFTYETFFALSPSAGCDDPLYSEDDFEYLPNGDVGGTDGPRMFTTTYFTFCSDPDTRDRETTNTLHSLAGWHTLVATVKHDTVTYYIDGSEFFSTDGKYYPRQDMTINFNEWFDGLVASSIPRSYDEQVGWVYFRSGQALTTAQVQHRVQVLSSHGVSFSDTVPNPGS